MGRARSFSFPRSSASHCDEGTMAVAEHPNITNVLSPAHSRSSSGASATTSPTTSAFPNRSHNRCPSSSSSLLGAPDSPMSVTKSSLHDLVEDPAERDESAFDGPFQRAEEPLCICDTPFCEHTRTPSMGQPRAILTATPDEWTPGDDFFTKGELPGVRSTKRRRSGEHSIESFTARLSRRWPSLSAKWRDRRPSVSINNVTVQSAPSSRATSVRSPSLRQSIAPYSLDAVQAMTPPVTPIDAYSRENALISPQRMSRLTRPTEIMVPRPITVEDPPEAQELATTPLLPPIRDNQFRDSLEQLQSPLQSPSIAAPGSAVSLIGTPAMTAVLGALPTPPLSSRPSIASFSLARPGQPLPPCAEIPPMSISAESDPWADKLGHANFHISPEPYLPAVCNMRTCQQLLNDWAKARIEYMKQAARISENHGPTSHIYRFTEQKWAEIDDQWRSYHQQANALAGVNPDSTLNQPLAETQPLSKVPTLDDPTWMAADRKFCGINENNIVGPMVQYAKIQREPSHRRTILKLFTDPASLLGRRSAFSFKR